MTHTTPRPKQPAPAPQEFRDGLAELFQMGLRVARMVARSADAETELAEAASHARAADGVSAVANSLAEAIEADRATAAAAEARQTVVARTQAVATAFAQVSRAIRLTIMLAERLDRGWAQGGAVDDRKAMAKRQVARAVVGAIEREAKGERAVTLHAELRERLERLDTEGAFENRAPEEIIAIVCRHLKLDRVRMTVQPPVAGAAGFGDVGEAAAGGLGVPGWPPRRRPDG